MKWIDFTCIANEEGLELDSEIDSIETRRTGTRGMVFDICYTSKDGYEGVIEIADDD